MKKWFVAMPLLLVSMLLFAGAASAHVVVYPQETKQGAYEKFTVRVPNEKDIATVKVQVRIPETAAISRVEPKPDWNYEMEKDESGTVTSITWTSTGAGIQDGEFVEFNMQGKVADDAAQIVWKAYQTYEDGSVVEWTGAEDSETPASVTSVNGKATGHGDGHGGGVDAAAAGEAAAADEEAPIDNSARNSILALSFGIASMILSVINLIILLFKKAKN
ncbi:MULTISPECIES: YcnI family protein [unclassified Paenibacillus]|uniref:YcnI family copper-binding membrane protein n=1 Tax=unclassified Paenibacillus TaxID=185978 RepID=UPI001C1031FD|nr:MULTISPECIES: YcnI family protein [unclassified Paenibacillus]MBU5442826.1 YcnI family protein [Paenibacillus sp. MSJ-34]CAH0117900.1 putative protein YcnI [Paenibacillus sp. CECT 9249]